MGARSARTFFLFPLARCAVVDLLVEYPVDLLGREQRRGLDLGLATGRDLHRKARRGAVVRQIEDRYHIIVAESEIEAFEFAAERLDGTGNGRFPGRSAVVRQSLDALGVVRCLSQVFWHHILPYCLKCANAARSHHTPVPRSDPNLALSACRD